MEQLIALRMGLLKFIYKKLVKPILFRFDPEDIHDLFTKIGYLLGKLEATKDITRSLFNYSNPTLKQEILGLHFKNPIGLAAGLDKDANLTQILPSVGFGFEEVGSITYNSYSGNPRPRLFRLEKSQALVVNYGLKNLGSRILSAKLKKLQNNYLKSSGFVLGTSIAKTNSSLTVDEESGIRDYLEGIRAFSNIGHYFTINISCPNTFDGQPFHDPEILRRLLLRVDEVKTKKPIFIKFSPDLEFKQIDSILEVCKRHRIDGFVLSNLTKARDLTKIKDRIIPLKGGLSGKVVFEKSNKLIEHVYKRTQGKYIIIGCGGVFSAQDAYQKIKAGASLVQLITGMVFEGPQLIGQINKGLVKLLKEDGYKNIGQAVGTGVLLENNKPTEISQD